MLHCKRRYFIFGNRKFLSKKIVVDSYGAVPLVIVFLSEMSKDFSCKKVWFLLFNPNDNEHNLDHNCELMASRTSNEHTYDNDRT